MAKKIIKIAILFILVAILFVAGYWCFNNKKIVKKAVITVADSFSYTYATLTGKDKIEIIKQPVSVAVPSGVVATVGVEALGDDLDYEWYFNDGNGEQFIYSPNYNGNKYSVSMGNDVNGREVYCIVRNKYGISVQSDVVTIRKSVPIASGSSEKIVPAVNGEYCILSAESKLSGELEYQWYFADKGSNTFLKSSITTKDYQIMMDDERNGRKVYCVVKNNEGQEVKTQVANLKTAKKLVITKQPTDVTLMTGRMATASVEVSGEGTLKYAWYICNKGSDTFVTSSDVDSEYSFVMSSKTSGRKAFCVISDSYGQKVTTDIVTFEKDPDALHVLIVGNSHSLDAFWYLRDVYLDQNPNSDIMLGIIYSSGGSITVHADAAVNNRAVIRYYRNYDNEWLCSYNVTHRSVFEDQEWDIILMQPSKKDIVDATISKKSRYQLMEYVNEYVKNPHEFMWHITWPSPNEEKFFSPDYIRKAPEGYKEYLIESYDFNPIKQYTEKVEQTKKVIFKEKAYSKLICTGSSVMHALYTQGVSQFVMYRDYTHLSDYGRLLSAYSLYAQLVDKPIENININVIKQDTRFHLFAHLGDIVLTQEEKDIIIKAANYSLKSPWVIPVEK